MPRITPYHIRPLGTTDPQAVMVTPASPPLSWVYEGRCFTPLAVGEGQGEGGPWHPEDTSHTRPHPEGEGEHGCG
jgi:hypothetical protein